MTSQPQNCQLSFQVTAPQRYSHQPVLYYDQSYAWARNQAANVTPVSQSYSGTPYNCTAAYPTNHGNVPSMLHPPCGQSSTATTPHVQTANLPLSQLVPTDRRSASNSNILSSEVYVATSVQEGLHILLWQGKSALVQGLLSNALKNNQLACLTAVISRGIIQTLQAAGLPQAGAFEELLRSEVVDVFETHWKWDGDWRIESELLVKQPQHKGINMASYLGALFAVGILSGDHVHACLDVLRHHAVHFDRLQAMHAIIIEAGDRMCIGHSNRMKSKHLRDMLTEKCSVSGRFIWGPDVISSLAVDNMLQIIDRWFSNSQGSKENQRKANTSGRTRKGGGNRTRN